MKRVFKDEYVELWCGDFREGVPTLDVNWFDLIIADPPYGQTSLAWDKWPRGWPAFVSSYLKTSGSLWCYGSLKMFMREAEEFRAWTFAQDVVWEKQNGTNFHADRFRRVHEQIAQFYQGDWESVYKDVQTTPRATKKTVRRKSRPPHTGHIENSTYVSFDGGPLIERSVRKIPNCHGYAIHPTEKPTDFIEPIIAYSCPAGGTVLVPFAGSGSELEACRRLRRRAIGYEVNTEYAKEAAERLNDGNRQAKGQHVESSPGQTRLF